MMLAMRKLGLFVSVVACLWLGVATLAYAIAEAGMVANMDGSLVAKGADGVLRQLALGKKVFAGDTLFTGKDSHARIKYTDGGVMILKPLSQFKIENFNFDASQPKADQATFNLLKGGLRAVSGLVGKRGNPDSFGVKTEAATVGIRGTHFGLRLCKGDCADIPTKDNQPLEDGLHVDVAQGVVEVSNGAGARQVRAGGFAFAMANNAAPVEVSAERATPVEIPPGMAVDKVRGPGQDNENVTPNTCPAN